MLSDTDLLADLRGRIESQLAWGPAEQWTNADFNSLSERITEVTLITLSPSTLKRVWGRVNYQSQPSTTTLDALAAFAGYESWRAYRTEKLALVATPEPPPPAEEVVNVSEPSTEVPNRPVRIYLPVALTVAAVALLTLLLYSNFAPAASPIIAMETAINPDDYHFTFRPVTSGVPNSVVFNYNAERAPGEGVYLQQSWDPDRREQLPRDGNTHTSIYYLPGYYRAKLIVEDQVVREREVFITSDDWVAAVDVDPVPVYLPLKDVKRDGRLAITATQLTDLGLDLQPTPPKTTLSHVGALEGLWSDDFSFRTRLRHDYATGAAACQYARVLILLKNGAIIIPLSAPGCVADLELYAGGRRISGRDTDLSAFGVVGDSWLELSCTGRDDLLVFSVNGREVFQLEGEEEPQEIIGIRYEFTGMGSGDELSFGNGGGAVWGEEF